MAGVLQFDIQQAIRLWFSLSHRYRPWIPWSVLPRKERERGFTQTVHPLAIGWTLRCSNTREKRIFFCSLYPSWLPLGPNQSPLQWTPEIFPGSKATDVWRCQPLPSSAEVKEIVELYRYSLFVPTVVTIIFTSRLEREAYMNPSLVPTSISVEPILHSVILRTLVLNKVNKNKQVIIQFIILVVSL